MAKTVRVGGYKVREPKGGLKDKHRAAIAELVSDKGGRLRQGEGCTIVLFKAKTGDPVAAQRCDGAKLAPKAKTRFDRMKRAGEICHRKGLFSNRCGRGR